jgi:pyruvate kinase
MAGEGAWLEAGSQVALTSREVEGTSDLFSHNYASLATDVKPGDPILLDDGLLALTVESVDGEEVRCKVKVGGLLKDHKGINLPGSALSTPALTEKDRKDLVFARELGVDYLALSFVRSAEDVRETKALAGDVPVIAKIEKPEAVADLEAVLDAADGAMVARGDLGVEAGHEKVPLIQKRIVRETDRRAKPVITATQMLDSMVRNPTPTRAEVSDVANAVLDGTDAVMLSAETSVGKYPVETVATMAKIIEEVENSDLYDYSHHELAIQDDSFSNAIADAANEVAETLHLSAIAVYTESGRSAALVSAHRPRASVIAFSRHDRVLNKLALYWGVNPLHGDWVKGVQGVVLQSERELLRHDLVGPGDLIAVTFGVVVGEEPFQTNILKLWKVQGHPPA